MVDSSIIESVKKYLQALSQNGVPVQFAVVFGSRAAGKNDEYSDIDLVVVSPLFDQSRTRHHVNILWRTAARTDSRIEPIPCGASQWDSDDSSTIIEVARRSGITVSA